MGGIVTRLKENALIKKTDELALLIANNEEDKIRQKISIPEYQEAAKNLSFFIIHSKNNEIIRMIVPYVDVDKSLKYAIFKNSDKSIIDILIENGATPPPILGNPDMKCKIRKYTCGKQEDVEDLKKLYEKIKDQLDNLYFYDILDDLCEMNNDFSDNIKRYYYISTAKTNDDKIILCGVMKVLDDRFVNSVFVNYLSTQSPINPYVKAQRVGSKLIKALITDAKRAKRELIRLNSVDWAVSFYEKLGFVKNNEEPGNSMIYKIINTKDL